MCPWEGTDPRTNQAGAAGGHCPDPDAVKGQCTGKRSPKACKGHFTSAGDKLCQLSQPHLARDKLPYASASSSSGRDQKMFQEVSNHCSAHSTDGQMEARKDEATLLQLQSRGWHLGLLMAHLIQVTKPRWHSGDVQYWVIVSIRGHPNFCPVLTKMQCCCLLSGLPRAGFTLQSSAGDRLPFPPDSARMGHEPTLPCPGCSVAPARQGAG